MKPILSHLSTFVLGILATLIINAFTPVAENAVKSLMTGISPPPTILADSPTAISQWRSRHTNEAEAQKLARDRYYGKYVEWEVTVANVLPQPTHYNVIITESLPNRSHSKLFCTFAKDFSNMDRLEYGVKIHPRGEIAFITNTSIHLEDCSILKILG